MSELEEPLEAHLHAWREDSLKPPLPDARERARAAMMATVASTPARRGRTGHRLSGAGFRLRHGSRRLAGVTAAMTAVAATLLLGWNAPVGSPLYGLRAARQSVQLAVPGADLAALHLEFAGQSLTDARDGVNPAASLADARSELDAALAELPADHTSPLWSRWDGDEALLTAEESALTGRTAPSGTGSSGASADPSESSGGASDRPSGSPGADGTGYRSGVPVDQPEAGPSGRPEKGESGSAAPSAGPRDG